jgi:SAM-dependent MidA family methyltransferase
VTPLEEFLRAEIARRGPITFAEYMELALYHPEQGYYASGKPRASRGGDFVTSPEIDDAFAELWTGAFARVWEALGRPLEFSVIEIGPGEGSFARAVLQGARGSFGDALHYVLVEPRPIGRGRQQSHIADARAGWAPSINDVLAETGVVFANEVLDNQPVHLVRPDRGRLVEIFVDAPDTGLGLFEAPASSHTLADYLEAVDLSPLPGRMQVGIAAAEIVSRAARALDRGALFFVDYGLEARELLERGGNSVVTYSSRGAATDPLEDPGRQDITAHVDWTGIRIALQREGLVALGPIQQASVLRALGLAAVDDRLRREHNDAIASGDGVGAVRLLSRRNAIGTLANTAGLGGLQVMAGGKGLDEESLGFLEPA